LTVTVAWSPLAVPAWPLKTGVVLLELVDQPSRIINAHVKLVSGAAQKCACQLAQFAGRFPRQNRQLRATLPIDQTIFEINPDLGVGSLK